MANTLDHAMKTHYTGNGKGRVGEPPVHRPGAVGVPIRVAVFFDGTKNNRSNTQKRLRDTSILQGKGKDDESSYANFYSNVSIMEELNQKKSFARHEVSVYVEGIGTTNFDVAKNPVKRDEDDNILNEDGEPLKDKGGKPVPLTDATNGNDDLIGYAIGSGTTGITKKVDKGIKLLRSGIAKAYSPGNNEVISKLIIDVVGFSRGAAAARYFVHRRHELQLGPGGKAWPKQSLPEIEINFVGLFDTVSSYERLKGASLEAALYLNSLHWVPGPGGIPIPLNPHEISTDEMFGDDVLQLHLGMGNAPKRVVHLTAADEYRENFSLTNINTSLHAKVGFELTMPGVHSDIGGGYVEPEPDHTPGKPRDLNLEVRRIKNDVEKKWLIEQGWYTSNQFRPWKEITVLPAIPQLPVLIPRPIPLPPIIVHTPPVKRQTVSIWEDGVRYLTNEYQYVPLSLMLDFAINVGHSAHQALAFREMASVNAAYKVPAALESLRAYFLAEARRLDGQAADRPPKSVARQPQVACRSTTERNWLRNKYLHRSARLPSEIKIGMAGRLDGARDGHHRLTIPDDVLHEKPQDALVRQTKEKAQQLKKEAAERYEQFKRGTRRLYERAKEEVRKDVNEAEEQVQQAAHRAAEAAREALRRANKALQEMPPIPPPLF